MYKAIVIGTSFGGLEALKLILPKFDKDFPLPIIIVLHIGNHSNDTFIRHLNDLCQLHVKEADSNESITKGNIYFAPPNYHLMVENNFIFSLSNDEKVNFSRPSIDILFESAAWVYKNSLIGIILTGANSDGAKGLKNIQDAGGLTIVQNPCKAIAPTMPRAALKLANNSLNLEIDQICDKINEILKR